MKKNYNAQTLNEFIIQQQTAFPYAKGDLSRLLNHIGVASKLVNREVNKAGLEDILGEEGKTNIQGESVQKLDAYANEQFIKILSSSAEVCGIASEENQEVLKFDNPLSREGKYVVCLDPLDGSSNIDVNVSIGTIFSVYRRKTHSGSLPEEADFLQPGTEQVAAGYIVYGSSTMLVYTTGMGVTGFTLDPSIGEFCLSHYRIETPAEGTIYSVNEGNISTFDDGIKRFIKFCQGIDGSNNKPLKGRYIGSLVADFHRNLLKGGIYMYPATKKQPHGKIRLLYECNPVAFLTEQAGGKATDGCGHRVMEIIPKTIHQRIPFFAGSAKLVNKLEECIADICS